MTIVGVRSLHVATAKGEAIVVVRMFAPVPIGPKWDCRYEIDWPEGKVESHAEGNDALHALNLAQQKIGTDLYMSRYHHERKMWWLKPWVGYGFPVPKGARDLLVGTDAEFYGD